MTPYPTQDDAVEALRKFLLAVLPDGVDAISGLINRVPEPSEGSFVVMTPTTFVRLRTNVDSAEDVRFFGSISGTTLTVTDDDFGTIAVGATLFGSGVAAGTKITAFGTGTGGDGTYEVSVSQTLSTRLLSSGAKSVEQGAMMIVQLDFHSANPSDAGDMAQTVSTLFRDEFATDHFAEQDPPVATPLYADDPRRVPFENDQQQYEWRWVVEVCMQVNQVVAVPQQYADAVEVELVSVDAVYPPD